MELWWSFGQSLHVWPPECSLCFPLMMCLCLEQCGMFNQLVKSCWDWWTRFTVYLVLLSGVLSCSCHGRVPSSMSLSDQPSIKASDPKTHMSIPRQKHSRHVPMVHCACEKAHLVCPGREGLRSPCLTSLDPCDAHSLLVLHRVLCSDEP